jgi:hypothetical protein
MDRYNSTLTEHAKAATGIYAKPRTAADLIGVFSAQSVSNRVLISDRLSNFDYQIHNFTTTLQSTPRGRSV